MHGGICRWTACLLAVGALAAGSTSARGQSVLFPGSDPAYGTQASSGQMVSASSTYAELESRLTALETRWAEEEAGGVQQDVCPTCNWVDTSNQPFSVCLGGRIFGDYVLYAGQDPASVAAFGDQENYFEFRSIRLRAEGQGYGVFDYRLELDFEPENGGGFEAVQIRDVYMGIHEVPILGYVRIGNFKEPFSLEKLTRLEHTTFMERALPTSVFAPGRHVGIGFNNHTANQRWTIGWGAFFDQVNIDHGPITDDTMQILKQNIDDNQGIDLPVRLTWNPIYTAGGRGVLHTGVGYVWTDDRDDLVSFSALPEVHEGNAQLSTGVLAIDNYHRLNFELAGVYGPFSVQSELFYLYGNAPAGFFDRDLYGAYVYGSWFLTGENRVYDRVCASFCRVVPNTNFWLVRTCDRGVDWGWGAWELAARWSYLNLEGPPDIGPLEGLMNDFTLGVNWHWNPHMRMMLNYIHSWGSVNAVPAVVADTDILAMRFQVDF